MALRNGPICGSRSESVVRTTVHTHSNRCGLNTSQISGVSAGTIKPCDTMAHMLQTLVFYRKRPQGPNIPTPLMPQTMGNQGEPAMR